MEDEKIISLRITNPTESKVTIINKFCNMVFDSANETDRFRDLQDMVLHHKKTDSPDEAEMYWVTFAARKQFGDWIPTKERYPDFGERVLVCSEDDISVAVLDALEKSDVKETEATTETWIIPENFNTESLISHWMVLPKNANE